jgi:hypothetical protein
MRTEQIRCVFSSRCRFLAVDKCERRSSDKFLVSFVATVAPVNRGSVADFFGEELGIQIRVISPEFNTIPSRVTNHNVWSVPSSYNWWC